MSSSDFGHSQRRADPGEGCGSIDVPTLTKTSSRSGSQTSRISGRRRAGSSHGEHRGHVRPIPQRLRSIVLAAVASSIPLLGVASKARAQGVSTAIIRGTVRTDAGANVDGARVRVLNTATGVSMTTLVTHGRFIVHGLD